MKKLPIFSFILCLGLSACVSNAEDDAITLENDGGKMDGARLKLKFNASHTYQRLELICDSPSGCDLTASLQFMDAWGSAPLDTPTAFAIAQLGAKVDPAGSNQYTISTAGDLTDPDATRSYSVVSGSDTTGRSLPDGMLEVKIPVANGSEAIAIGRAGTAVTEFSVSVSASWTPHPN